MEYKESIKIDIGGKVFGFPTTLFIVFMVLKLCGVITWSWWWVTAPVWVSATLVMGVIFLIILMCVYRSRK